jgi:hypothetical protein
MEWNVQGDMTVYVYLPGEWEAPLRDDAPALLRVNSPVEGRPMQSTVNEIEVKAVEDGNRQEDRDESITRRRPVPVELEARALHLPGVKPEMPPERGQGPQARRLDR